MYRIALPRTSLPWTSLLTAAAVAVVSSLLAGVTHAAPTNPEKLSLWSGQAPVGDGRSEAATVSITVFRPAPEKANGTAVVICPGGGYQALSTVVEGSNIGKWLNQHGITGIMLEYRFPRGRAFVPLLDAQRAIRTVRFNAKRWNITPNRIGILGFSAGGHLASTAATHFDAGDSKATNPIDRVSCRPDFAILVYPVVTMGAKTHGGSKTNLLGPNPKPELVELFSNEKQVTDQTPPMFLAHAKDDTVVTSENSQMLYDALKAHQVATEYLELPSGNHGLNRFKGPMWEAWQAKSLEWLAAQKLIPQAGGATREAKTPAAKEASRPYRIGAGSVDITPTWPTRLAGFAGRNDLSTGVYLPLHVKVLTLDDGRNKVVHLMADIIGWDSQRKKGSGGVIQTIREALKKRYGLEPGQIVMTATHTHCGPVLEDERFRTGLIEKAIALVGEDLAGAREGRLYFGRGTSDISANRRGLDTAGTAQWRIDPYATHDHEVVVLKAVDNAGNPIAVAINYACHPTTIGGLVIGGDYAGYAQAELEKRLGGGATALFLQGTGGDMKPDRPKPNDRYSFDYTGGSEEPAKFGRRLADDVGKVLAGPMEEITGPIRTAYAVVELPVLSAWKGTVTDDPEAKLDPANPLSGPLRRQARIALAVRDSMDASGRYKVTQPCEVYVTRIGKSYIDVGLNGEMCSPIGLRIKDQLRGKQVLVTGYTGYGINYFAGAAQIPAGGYEVYGNPHKKPYSPEAEDFLIGKVMEMAGQLEQAQPKKAK